MKRLVWLLLGGVLLLPPALLAGDELVLVGAAEIGGTKLAYVKRTSNDKAVNLVQGKEISGLRLLDLNAGQGWAVLQQGSNQLTLRMANAAKAAFDPTGARGAGQASMSARATDGRSLRIADASTSPENGQVATATDVAAVREHIKGLPAEERELFQKELGRFHAAAAGNQNVGETQPAQISQQDSSAPNSAEAGPFLAVDFSSLESDLAEQLGFLLSTAAPLPGTRQGSVDEIARLRRLRNSQADPIVRARILQEVHAYASVAD